MILGLSLFYSFVLLRLQPTLILSTSLNSESRHRNPYYSVTEKDSDIIREQLGYIPDNLVSVSAKSSSGIPIALKTYSLNGGASRRKAKAMNEYTPFPTLYWHCCPKLANAISSLEGQGYISVFEEKLMNDPEAAKDFIKCHEGYALERWNSLTEDDQSWVLNQSEKIQFYVRHSGISGTDFSSFLNAEGCVAQISIKCLHTHYAHYRSQKENDDCNYPLNIVGLWTHELLARNMNMLDL